jgi:uncharacterized protein
MPEPFLDTNVLIRHLTRDHSEHSPRSTAYLARVLRGELSVWLSDLVVFEVIFTLERTYKQSKPAIRAAVLDILELPGVVLPGKQHYHQVLDLYVDRNISFPDAYHAELMRRENLDTVVSFDKDFDRIPGITRIEP